ncbi:helix-turn-helix transcriptional regulator [Acidisphaera sp. S103]|uniref:helix-turn-helix transcriptional regulator n=1 Tax=Acidisphaera sp. S103 TaxID=1747223 RepID=UPI00131A8F19
MRKRVSLLPADADVMATLGRRVRAARLRRNWSQAEMAQRAGVTRKTYAALESGDTGVSVGCLLKTLAIFGYSDRLGSILDADPIGADLELETGRRRSSRSGVSDVENF